VADGGTCDDVELLCGFRIITAGPEATIQKSPAEKQVVIAG